MAIAATALAQDGGSGSGGPDAGASAIRSGDIVDKTIRGQDVKNNTLSGRHIINGRVTTTDIRNNNVGSQDIRDGSLNSSDIGSNTLNGSDVANDTLTGADVAEETFDQQKLENVLGVRDLPRKTMAIDPAVQDGDTGGPVEEWTAVGPLKVLTLCRNTDDGGTPAEEGQEREAKILVQSDSGSFSMFGGMNGPRRNVPEGAINFEEDGPGSGDNESPGSDGRTGEGAHTLVNASNENGDDNDDEQDGEADLDGEEDLNGVFPALDTALSGYVAGANGTEFIVTAYAAVNVLGVGADACAFGGRIDIVKG